MSDFDLPDKDALDGFELYPIAVDQSLHITSLFLVSVVIA